MRARSEKKTNKFSFFFIIIVEFFYLFLNTKLIKIQKIKSSRERESRATTTTKRRGNFSLFCFNDHHSEYIKEKTGDRC